MSDSKKVVPFQKWRPLTPEEASFARTSFRWLRVSRVAQEPRLERPPDVATVSSRFRFIDLAFQVRE
jgi:hypothetical protein